MLTNKVALVTGGSRGIGRAVALELAKEGAKVVVNYAGNEAKAAELLEEIKALGGEGAIYKADVSKAEEVNNMVDFTLETFGSIDILVNNAGVTRDNLLMRMKDSEWDEVIDINLKGVFYCLKAVTRPMMKQKSGCIINIASVVGISGNAGQANYVAAKAGVIGLTKTAAKELAPRGITVNAIAPGFIETDMTDKLNEEIKSLIAKQIPLGTMGKPEDIAHAVAFLSSDKARYITGQVLVVDGGMVM
ncbi:3-oxoacyl-[acyl-carrier-protein] reductase [Desulfuribacillus stibiiarsenatis]|uniref:3-oxoacyl-[acyl-carrier-protein] reductase n=1 Tax=Desulfuribacillus stibiiarsenatis TaxID=1390249 RepID=A0A1E5L719_9FIRM|nr:3-oxoacyl-[acyl-carrier-protein] reductase [Desulfuribacillus stibiiarsenatis]OEH85779.1 3-oxoacyl-[acyl-carrier-protein] reductase [Desulfuribacillus stibiiarsenatis]